MKESTLAFLKESMQRNYVQEGYVTNIRKLKAGNGLSTEVVAINFDGETLFCATEEFSKRKLTSYGGFLNTPVPFVVERIDEVNSFVFVSRVKALAIKVRQFEKNFKVGQNVPAIVTGFSKHSNGVYISINGMPAYIKSGEWGVQQVQNIRDFVDIGTEVEVKITDIEKSEGDENWELPVKVNASRRAVIRENISKVWNDIELHHSVGDTVVAKVIKNFSYDSTSYLLQVVSSGIVIMGFATSNVREQYRVGLAQGILVHAEIRELNKEKQAGKARIFRVDPQFKAIGNASRYSQL